MSWGIAFRLRQQLKGSLYALPVLGALLGPVLGQLTLWLDRSVQLSEGPSTAATGNCSQRPRRVHGGPARLRGHHRRPRRPDGDRHAVARYMRLWYRDLLQKVVLATSPEP